MTKVEKLQRAKAKVDAKFEKRIAKLVKADADKAAKVKAKEVKKAARKAKRAKKVAVKPEIKSF